MRLSRSCFTCLILGVFKPTPFETLPRSLSRLVFSVAYDALLRCPFGTICERVSRHSMFHKGCGIDIPADHFRNSGWAAPMPIFGDQTPISNDISAYGKLR